MPHLNTSIMNFERFVKEVHFDQLQDFKKKSLLCALTNNKIEQWTEMIERDRSYTNKIMLGFY